MDTAYRTALLDSITRHQRYEIECYQAGQKEDAERFAYAKRVLILLVRETEDMDTDDIDKMIGRATGEGARKAIWTRSLAEPEEIDDDTYERIQLWNMSN